MNKIITLFATLLSIHAIAQQDYSQMSVPSPEVASLLRYIEKPVSLYNGQVAVNIPLYTVKDGSVEIPIAISYNTSGIKVAEEASMVGLGWNLNIGGFINQEIRGDEDAQETKLAFNDPETFLGDAVFFSSVFLPGDDYNGYAMKQFGLEPDQYYSVNSGFVANLLNHSPKYQPDIYHYNFGGYSGKFYIDQYDDVIYQEKPDPKIYFEKTVISGKNGFKAVMPDGTTYFFNGAIGVTGRTWHNQSGKPSSISYYLSEVVMPDGQGVFYYYAKAGMARSNFTRSELVEDTAPHPTIDGFDFGGKEYSRTTTFTDYEVIILQKIETRNITVDFSYAPRLDLWGTEKQLQSITISAGSDERNIMFKTSYFVSPTTDNFYESSVPLSDTDTKRLRLDSIKIDGIPCYKFQYNSTQLPVKRSYAVDYWGFYNGQVDNTTLFPKQSYLNFFSSYRFDDGDAVRAASPSHSMACVLEKVTYPMGGDLSLSYEPNTFDNYKIPTIDDLKNYEILDYPFSGMHIDLPGEQLQDNNVPGNDRTSYFFQLTEPQWVTISGEISYGTGIWQQVADARISLSRMGSAATPPEPVGTVFSWYYTQQSGGKFTFSETLLPGWYTVSVYLPDDLGQQIKPFPPEPGELRNCGAEARIYIPPLPSTLPWSKGAGLRLAKVVNTAVESGAVTRQFAYNLSNANGTLMSPLRFSKDISIGHGEEKQVITSGQGDGYTLYQEFWVPTRVTSSNSHFPISYAAMGALVGYSKVREYRPTGSEPPEDQGYIEYEYYNEALPWHPDFVPEFPVFTNGLLKSQKSIHGNGQELESISYRYVATDRHRFFGIASVDNWKGPWGDYHYGYRYNRFQIAFNMLSSRMVRPLEIVETTQGISITKKIQYNDDGLPTLETQDFSDGKTIKTATTYYSNTTLPDHGERYLINNLPMEKTISINDVQDRKDIYTFTKIGQSSNGGYVTIPHYNITGQKTYLTTSPVSTELNYKYFSNKISEVQSSHGPTKVYLWGYGGTRMVGEIIGATETEVENAPGDQVLNDQLISNYDNSLATWMTRFSTLRSNLPNTHIKSFTYNLLQGVSSITDSNNLSIYYSYDALGRLAEVKDNNGNILNTYYYHYKTP